MKKNLLNLITIFSILSFGVNAQTKNLGTNVNTIHNEVRPVITADGNSMFFTIEGGPTNRYKDGQDIFVSHKTDSGEWGKAERLPDIINRHRYNSVYWASEDGNKLLIRGEFNEKEKQMYRGFSTTRFENGEWTKPEVVVIQDFNALSRGVYVGATMTSDEKVIIMYFSSEDKSDYNDLWISFRIDSTGQYSKPEKLILSTEEYDEFSPFIASDNKTLFFASDKDGGFGSSDIWMSKRTDTTWKNWSIPVNIGIPFNTKHWDAYFYIGEKDSVAYFATNKKHSIKSSMGGADLFSAILPETFRPEKPIEPIHDTIVITIIKCDTIYITKTIPCNPYDTMDINQLKKELTKGKILFDYGKSILRSDAFKKLDIMISILKRNPEITIELRGYSDSVGTKEGNYKQSVERSKSAKSYLLSRGIENKRIIVKGYGDKNPVATNKTDEGRQLNRRVDIIIIDE